MATQKRLSSRNYIDLVEDEGDKQHVADPPPALVRPMKEYLLGLLAAMRTPRSEAR